MCGSFYSVYFSLLRKEAPEEPSDQVQLPVKTPVAPANTNWSPRQSKCRRSRPPHSGPTGSLYQEESEDTSDPQRTSQTLKSCTSSAPRPTPAAINNPHLIIRSADIRCADDWRLRTIEDDGRKGGSVQLAKHPPAPPNHKTN